MMEETGCDGIMVGRATVGNPWIFREIKSYLETGVTPDQPTLGERIDVALRHLKLLAADPHVGEERAVKEMRGQLPQFFKGFPGVTKLRSELVRFSKIDDIEEFLRHAPHQDH